MAIRYRMSGAALVVLGVIGCGSAPDDLGQSGTSSWSSRLHPTKPESIASGSMTAAPGAPNPSAFNGCVARPNRGKAPPPPPPLRQGAPAQPVPKAVCPEGQVPVPIETHSPKQVPPLQKA